MKTKNLKLVGLLSVMLMLTSTLGVYSLTVSTGDAQTQGVIPVPDISAIDRPYKTIEELGIDFETIDEYFPQQIEVKRDGDKIYVEDIGVGYADVWASSSFTLVLADGYWTADIDGDLEFIYFYSFEDFGEDKYWSVTYRGDGTRDSYIHLNDNVNNVKVSFSYEYGEVMTLYESGDYRYEDIYSNGVFKTHGVSNSKDTELAEVLYDINGNLSYCKLYLDTYYYYFPGLGWSTTWGEFTAGEAPAGYEHIDETYFTVNKPSLICSRAEGDDIMHDMTTSYCTMADTCKNGCGYTIGTIEHHTWQIVGEEKVCSVCDAVFFPDFKFVDRMYNTVEETRFPYADYRVLFPEVLTVKYEDGKYMVKDVGADAAEACTSLDNYVEIPLVDGWWIYELDEEKYSDESIDIFVTFKGEFNGGLWDINYFNGEVNGGMHVESEDTTQSVIVYYAEYDWVCFMYYVGDRRYADSYERGVLAVQEGTTRFGDDEIHIDYLSDKTIRRIYIAIDGKWFYYYPEIGWENGSGEPIAAPEGYENADLAFFASIVPTTINCTHEQTREADCENPECCLICGIDKEGSEPLGHNYVGEITSAPTCTTTGVKTFTCQNDEAHTYTEDVAIDENAHSWNEGAITSAPTCTTTGVKTFTCQNDEAHTYTEDVAIDENAHSWNEGAITSAPTCTTTGVKTFTCQNDEAHTYTEDIAINPENHNFGEWMVTKEATATENGEKARNCACGEKQTEVIPATGESNNDKQNSSNSSVDSGNGEGSDNSVSSLESGDEQSGCGSSITGGAFGGLTLLGATALVFLKKEKKTKDRNTNNLE